MGDNNDQVYLRVEGELFCDSRKLLSEHSAYFRAMFSGNYKEAKQEVINLEMIDASLMQDVLEYMHTGVWRSHVFSDVMRLFWAASFLQMDELVSCLERYLEDCISLETWLDILEVAEKTHVEKLAQKSASFGLISLPVMLTKVPDFPNIYRLHWYLSHSHLVVENEFQVFQLGAKWIEKQYDVHLDTIFVVIGSLCVRKLTEDDLEQIGKSQVVQCHALAASFVSCVRRILQIYHFLTKENVSKFEENFSKEFTSNIYEDVKRFVESSLQRDALREPCITAVAKESESERGLEPQYIYKWSCKSPDRAVEPWLKVADGKLWGWTWAVWDAHRVVAVGGEYGRGSGRFERGVRVYDTFIRSWSQHSVELPPRRHAGTVVHHNILYLICGVGSFRMILSSCVCYNLATQTYTSLADLPERIQSPAVTVYRDILFVAGQVYMYKLQPDQYNMADGDATTE